jgi:hypothetical protein
MTAAFLSVSDQSDFASIILLLIAGILEINLHYSTVFCVFDLFFFYEDKTDCESGSELFLNVF